MTSKLVSQLESFVKKVELLVQNLKSSSIQPSQDQYHTLEDLSLRLLRAAQHIPAEIEVIKKRRTESYCEEGRKLLAEAQLHRRELITTSQLKNRALFARNVTLFFEGQKDSVVDSSATRARKKLVRERCERICRLNPDGLISWAAAFTPTTWTANLMSKDTFDYVIEHIEPDGAQAWSSDIFQILKGIGAEEPLRGAHKYHEFLKVVEGEMETAKSSNQSRKRRMVVDESVPDTQQWPRGESAGDTQAKVTSTQYSDPVQMGRQIQYMFSKAPISHIHLLGSLLSNAVQTSEQWELERKQGLSTTECLTTLIPQGEDEDISITLWIGRMEGRQALELLKLQRTWSA